MWVSSLYCAAQNIWLWLTLQAFIRLDLQARLPFSKMKDSRVSRSPNTVGICSRWCYVHCGIFGAFEPTVGPRGHYCRVPRPMIETAQYTRCWFVPSSSDELLLFSARKSGSRDASEVISLYHLTHHEISFTYCGHSHIGITSGGRVEYTADAFTLVFFLPGGYLAGNDEDHYLFPL